MDLLGCGFNGFNQLEDVTDSQKRLPDFTKAKRVLPIKLNLPKSECSDLDKIEDVCIAWSSIFVILAEKTGNQTLYGIGNNCADEVMKIIDAKHIAISSDYLVYNNCNGELRLVNYGENRSVFQDKLLPIDKSMKEENIISNNIEQIIGGENCFYLIDDSGTLQRMEWNKLNQCLTIPHIIPLSQTVSHISCGKEHNLLITSTNQVFSWGLSSRGQLGNGDIEEIKYPKAVEALAGLNIKQISAGGWHSTAVTNDGDLYVWGWNESGQLGLPCPALQGQDKSTDSVAILTIPHYIEIDETITKVSCGSRHTCILLENGNVMSCGWNKYGQLGLGDVKSKDNFSKVDFSSCTPGRIADIFSSNWNSVFLIKT
ncbi:uncharacterized protein LOC126816687 isoform X1 [Patella vulgata]|uniref:uncharacterized protein LOC126816687 isoform X1 n=1 Tax=Patella vulgata TaxID=6465 RepID=UPI00217F9323|nr:uncharacterized protein LOC126816687 isoform X1 [Patella vulgata]XP_050399374.1 uncharacterized protein LOC126816687 isoform X1 [Patella vulgata]